MGHQCLEWLHPLFFQLSLTFCCILHCNSFHHELILKIKMSKFVLVIHALVSFFYWCSQIIVWRRTIFVWSAEIRTTELWPNMHLSYEGLLQSVCLHHSCRDRADWFHFFSNEQSNSLQETDKHVSAKAALSDSCFLTGHAFVKLFHCKSVHTFQISSCLCTSAVLAILCLDLSSNLLTPFVTKKSDEMHAENIEAW